MLWTHHLRFIFSDSNDSYLGSLYELVVKPLVLFKLALSDDLTTITRKYISIKCVL